MKETTQIILNPKAQWGMVGFFWQQHQREILRALAPVDVAVAETPEAAQNLARASALKGFGRLVLVGDESTAHGVVNALMALTEEHRRVVKVGFLTLLHQESWSRTLGLPKTLSEQLSYLNAGHSRPFDLGRLECMDASGKTQTRFFLNGVSVGLENSGTGGQSHGFWGQIKSLPWKQILKGHSSRVRLLDGERLCYQGPWLLGTLMLGRYYPGFWPVAPEADPTDGQLDAAWADGVLSWMRSGFFSGLPPQVAKYFLSRGNKNGKAIRGEKFHLIGGGTPLCVWADGLAVGQLPATVSAEPLAMQVMVPEVSIPLLKPAFPSLKKAGRGRLRAHVKSPVKPTVKPTVKSASGF